MKKSNTSQIVGIVLNSILFILFTCALILFVSFFYSDFDIPMLLGVSLSYIYYCVPLFFFAALTCAIKIVNFAFIIKYGKKTANKIITAVLAVFWIAAFFANAYIGYREIGNLNSYYRYDAVIEKISNASNFCDIEENENTEYLLNNTYSEHFLNSLSLSCYKSIVYAPEDGDGDTKNLSIDMLVLVDAPVANKIAFSAIEKQLTDLKYSDDKMTAYGVVKEEDDKFFVVKDGKTEPVKSNDVNMAYISKRDNCFVYCRISAANDDFGLDREKTVSYLNNLIEDNFKNR